jgi:hypothetical protein
MSGGTGVAQQQLAERMRTTPLKAEGWSRRHAPSNGSPRRRVCGGGFRSSRRPRPEYLAGARLRQLDFVSGTPNKSATMRHSPAGTVANARAAVAAFQSLTTGSLLRTRCVIWPLPETPEEAILASQRP